MQLTITLLSLASLGLNILSVQAGTVPTADLARRADKIAARGLHEYGLDEDEAPVAARGLHEYGLDEDEAPVAARGLHEYGLDEDETM